MNASSPMTATSRVSGASDAPPLTVGTTASSSPSPLSEPPSPSLTPPPAPSSGKRKSAASSTEPKKRKKALDTQDEKAEKGIYCHQCRQKCEPEKFLRCTKLKKFTKSTPERACNLAWCERDLKLRYEVDIEAVRNSSKKAPGHDEAKSYVFACPCCTDACQNSTCRLRKGLPKLGDIVKQSKETGVSALELVARANAEAVAEDLFDGELSDPDVPKVTKTKAKPAAAPKKAAKATTKKPKATPAKAATKSKAAPAKKGKEKEVKKKGKEAAKETKKVTKKPPLKKVPERIVFPVVEPPILHPAETRMGREEAEQRMFVREFIVRFRHVLNLPDRALGPLDDFEHPLGESTVRQVFGALLDLIIADGGRSYGQDFMIFEDVEEQREELRQYADLARVAQVYHAIAEDLQLQLPTDPYKEAKERNDRAMRALLDIGEGESTPAWATDNAPTRRTAASRLPSPAEVVRMIIALINYTMELEAVRQDMEQAYHFSIGDVLRTMYQAQKAEGARWEEEKKKLNAARVRAKSAAETKKAKEKYTAQEKEHLILHRIPDINHKALVARKLLRFEPLGSDLDGRVYYSLTPRLIDEERYRPSGWARGVLIWGRGIEGQESDMPAIVERWMHVSTVADVTKLANWVGYRFRSLTEDMEWEAKQTANAAGEGEAVKKTPKKDKASKANGTATARMMFDGVDLSRNGARSEHDGSDSDSDLSSAPDESLLQLLNTEGYKPSADNIRREGYYLETGIREVAHFLEVLEWKGVR